MKILIINPTISGDFNTLHLGIASVASYINAKSKHKAFIADLAFRKRAWQQYLDRRIATDKPDLIAIYISTPMLNNAKKVMKYIKQKHKLPILAGGHHVTLCSEDAIKIKYIDYIIVGEGEHSLKEFLDALENKRDLKKVQSLWYKEGKNIKKNKIKEINTNINELPPLDWDLYNDLDKQLYFFEYIPLIGTRGCKFKCTFCSVNALRKRIAKGRNNLYYREKNPKLVVAEAKALWAKYEDKGMKFIRFSEPIFTTNKQWLREFKEEYIKAGLKGRPFSVYSMANELDEEVAKILSEIGCKVVRIGLETADEYILTKIFEKGTTLEDIKNSIKLSKKYGMEVIGYFIYGSPGETKESMKKTFKLIKEYDVDLPTILLLKPMPKTGIYRKIKQEKCRIVNNKWGDIDNLYNVALLESGRLKPKDVEWYQRKSYFYIAIRRLFREITYRKIGFFTKVIPYFIKGFKEGMEAEVIARSYLSRRHLK